MKNFDTLVKIMNGIRDLHHLTIKIDKRKYGHSDLKKQCFYVEGEDFGYLTEGEMATIKELDTIINNLIDEVVQTKNKHSLWHLEQYSIGLLAVYNQNLLKLEESSNQK